MDLEDKYAAGGWDGGLWGGNVEEASKDCIWDAIQWPAGGQMQYLKSFIFPLLINSIFLS